MSNSYFQSELRNAEKSGMDDGRSQTKHLMPRLKAICQTAAHGVAQTYLCSVVDHHSSSFGDKGWGCGYRNLQMLLSSLTHHTPYSERLGMTSGKGSGAWHPYLVYKYLLRVFSDIY